MTDWDDLNKKYSGTKSVQKSSRIDKRIIIIAVATVIAVVGGFSYYQHVQQQATVEVLRDFTDTSNDFISSQGSKLTLCAGIDIQVDSVADSTITYSNPHSVPITNITVFDMNGGNLTVNAPNLNPQEETTIQWTRGNNESIFLRGICENAVIAEGNCEEGEVCWEAGEFSIVDDFEQLTITTECNFGNLLIESCSYDGTDEVTIELYNIGTVDLEINELHVMYPDSSTVGAAVGETSASGEIETYTVSGIPPGYDSIEVRTHCPNVFESTSC